MRLLLQSALNKLESAPKASPCGLKNDAAVVTPSLKAPTPDPAKVVTSPIGDTFRIRWAPDSAAYTFRDARSTATPLGPFTCTAYPMPSASPGDPPPTKLDTFQKHGSCALSPATGHAVAGAQRTHADTDTFAKVPTGHDDDVNGQVLAPSALKVPGEHGTQKEADAAPTVALAVPAGHAVHVELHSAPLFTEYVPGAQGVHAVTSTAPVTLFHVPLGHGTWSPDPGGQYEPLGQIN